MTNTQSLRLLYVHGVHDHPPEAQYRAQWDAALRRQAYVSDIETRMMYWADIRLGLTEDTVRRARTRANKQNAAHFHRLRPQTDSPLGYAISLVLHLADPAIRRITKDLLAEIYHYFYDEPGPDNVRDAILDRMDAAMRALRPHIVVAHSWGSVIAYDYLVHRGHDQDIDALITVGSPLGQTYIQEHLAGFQYPERVRHWTNIFDAMDPATWPDRRIANDFPGTDGARLIRDVEVPSVYDGEGKRDPHSWFGYLMSEPVQNEIFRIATARALWVEGADGDGLRRAHG